MPWEEKNEMDQRAEFAQRALTESIPFVDLCDEYGISRKTGYKWKQRFYESGYAGMADLSRKPYDSPNQLSEDSIIRIINIKTAYPHWGPRKVLKIYKKSFPSVPAPSESSIKRILDG